MVEGAASNLENYRWVKKQAEREPRVSSKETPKNKMWGALVNIEVLIYLSYITS